MLAIQVAFMVGLSIHDEGGALLIPFCVSMVLVGIGCFNKVEINQSPNQASEAIAPQGVAQPQR